MCFDWPIGLLLFWKKEKGCSFELLWRLFWGAGCWGFEKMVDGRELFWVCNGEGWFDVPFFMKSKVGVDWFDAEDDWPARVKRFSDDFLLTRSCSLGRSPEAVLKKGLCFLGVSNYPSFFCSFSLSSKILWGVKLLRLSFSYFVSDSTPAVVTVWSLSSDFYLIL